MRTLLFVFFIAASCSLSAAAADLYVSTEGQDAWSGQSAEPNASQTDGPFATLQRARDEIRRIKAGGELSEPLTVHVRAGQYALPQTLKLDAQDSGTAAAPVLWRGYQAERPELIGGRPVADFQPYQDEILQADLRAQGLEGVVFRQLIFAGRRQHLARYPNFDPQNPYGGGWAYADGQAVPMYAEVPGEDRRTLQYQVGDTRSWAHPEEGEVFVFPRYNWWNNIVRIASIDRDTRTIKLAGDCSYPIRPTDRYYVRNQFEELDAPGEWYLDQRTGTLYFWPPEPLRDRPVYVPTMRTILDFGPGTAHVTFRGFVFECCEGTAIAMRETTACRIAASIIRNVGDYGGSGVTISGGKDNGVAGCDLHDIGRDAITLGGGDRKTLTAAGNFADNNYIHHTGVFYKQGVGVSLSGVGNRVSHNLIHDCPRFGIGFGGNNLVIEYNHIRHVNLETADTGAIYTGGRDWLGSRGTQIRYNYFHDILGYGQEHGQWVSPHYAWGIYLDDNAGGVDVIGNVVARAVRGLIHLHNGRDNLIENNILIDGKLQQLECNGWTDKHSYWTSHLPTMIQGYESVAGEPAWRTMRNMQLHPSQAVLPDGKIMTGNVYRRNIIYWRDPQAKYTSFRTFPFDHNTCDENLIWHFGQPLLTGQSQAGPARSENLVANPGFESGPPDALPAGWTWQMKPKESTAAWTVDTAAEGDRSLRMTGGVGQEANGRDFPPQIVSTEFEVQPGQHYRLAARLKAESAGAKAAVMLQSYIAGAYIWASSPAETTADSDWKECAFVFRVPAPGDRGYHEQMKKFRIRIDFREPSGTLWVDDVRLQEIEVLDEWASWQSLGMDRNSLVADPLFVDADRDDYRLQPESPAWKLGFQPIPLDKIGPYADPLRVTWPIVEAEGAREKPLVNR